MTALSRPQPSAPLDDYVLDDRFARRSGRVFLTGTQALVAILLTQRRLDRAAGLNTAGFVSGYRGSPLGGVDQALWRAKTFLDENDVSFLPAINEDLAATAVLGTQQIEIEPERTVDGVFAMWYGKGPGVDRAGDALKHGNAYGSSPHGGVLVVAGDDHGCVSSSMSHQSDVAFMAAYIPTINPANIGEYIEFGLWGYAASRFSGMWIGFKAISETVESAASVELPTLPRFKTPDDFIMPDGGLNFRWPDLPGMQIERRMRDKKEAVRAFARANPIDRAIFNVPDARYGVITTGKAHLDVMEALAMLGIDEKRAREIGLDIYKIGLVWPIEAQGAERFMAGKEEVLVVEEKRGIIESQLKEYLYDRAIDKPKRILGKHDEDGAALISWVEELSPSGLAPILANRLSKIIPGLDFSAALAELDARRRAVAAPGGARRLPYFCSGCPHNTSTRVPEGSRALAGIGCHFMASWMDRNTSDLIQMGGEGVNWASKSMFLKDRPHVFQNLGDGTYFHSGSMAIRQAIAAGANVTYKILYNDAVAMTGGQPIDGVLTVPMIARQVLAEGVKKAVIASDDPDAIRSAGGLPPGVEVRHRDELDAVQRALREVKGVTVLIYVQTCAAEKRRRRKRHEYPDPPKRMFINELVCEGCGDCSKQSNCLSIVPVETEFGRKRKIDQSSCNKDYSCVKGFCPSFVSIEGGALRKPEPAAMSEELKTALDALPEPALPALGRSFDLLVGGVGGTGVVTIGAIVTMAAHLEGKGASVLDFMGFAQKGGTVLSYVRLGENPAALNQVRIDIGAADAAIICDLVVGTDQRSLSVMRKGATRASANMEIMPTADFIRDRDIDFAAHQRLKLLKDACGDENVCDIDASAIAGRLLGDLVFSNMFLLGYSWQKGLVPVGLAALMRAIELNGVAVDKNRQAFALGRAAAVDPDAVYRAAGLKRGAEREPSLAELIARRADFLTAYQNRAYARRYRDFVERVAEGADALPGGEAFSRAVAIGLFKLMAYKDEYEVARLHTDGTFRKKIADEFEGDYKIRFHMAPPIFNRGLDEQGRPRKTTFGPWMYGALSVLRRFRFLRGTILDPFGQTAERRLERRLITEYRARIEALLPRLSAQNMQAAVAIARLPEDVRGYGPVKLASIEKTAARLDDLMRGFEEASAAKAA
ncbi:MAG: indolepyruvate ferredoxin oxidoreductase family protein [Alphaproteobacteria bacterium]|nr:indolepyruvate ferredoxin oxidoreductase family protein [Alphaproteobacteria bacterium]